MAGQLVTLDQIDPFQSVRDVPAAMLHEDVIARVRMLDEREELEPFIRSILADQNSTPHGPAELVDILTHKLTIGTNNGWAAFILKGKSFPTVRPKDLSHQIYRLEKIAGLKFAVLAVTGNILDQAQEEFVSTAERLACTYCIMDAGDLARLFVAYGFLCPRDGRRTSAGRCRCGYSLARRQLNLFQKQSLEELHRAHALGQKSGLIVLPPGSGKTRIAAQDAHATAARCVLYVAHTREILDLAESEFSSLFGTDHVKRTNSTQALSRPGRVNLATVQWLARHVEALPPEKFDYVVVDEFHHAAASSYRRLIDKIGSAFLLGLTATPFRGDRQDIIELCQGNILVNAELRTGIDSGVLAPYHYFGAFDDVDYSAIQYHGTSYTIRDLERVLLIPKRDRAIIRTWREHAEHKPTIAFCCSHKHATRVAHTFREQGIAAECYLSSTGFDERRSISTRLARGKTTVLCAVDILNEGADLPFVECLLFLRPTESKRIFFQQLGRGLRRFVGKSHCIVVDFIGNFHNAYRIVEYQGLLPDADELPTAVISHARSKRDVFNLPLGCEVHFDQRVLDIFARQAFRPEYATRHNIGRILIYQYDKLRKRLAKLPTRADVDRSCLLHSDFYREVFGSWKRFQEIVVDQA